MVRVGWGREGHILIKTTLIPVESSLLLGPFESGFVESQVGRVPDRLSSSLYGLKPDRVPTLLKIITATRLS